MLDRATALGDDLRRLRRQIHRYPELGYRETRTAALVADYLSGLGIPFKTGIAKTGIIAYLGEGRPVVMLRADMDALQVQEENRVPYASERPGLMHACGHDAHVACLLGAARLLSENPPPGQVRFLFQPSEEGADEEGKHGGRRVMEEGHVDDLDAVFALHVSPEIPSGMIAVREGPVSAASDRFRGAVLGRSSHGAKPQEGLDAVVLAAQVVLALNTIVSRRVEPMDSAVVTVGTLKAGTRHNIVAGRADLTGTLRSYKPETREFLIEEVERAFGLALALGGDYELDIDRGCPSVVNDRALTSLVEDVATRTLGAERLQPGDQMMGSEDFSFLESKAPGCFMRLGVGFQGEEPRIAHSPNFDVDDAALPAGTAMLAAVADAFLRRQANGEG
ncbi:MAG: M20 metallopeptidase family protein [Chloroflexota bacterium]